MDLHTHFPVALFSCVQLFPRIYLLAHRLNVLLRQFCSMWILPTIGLDPAYSAVFYVSYHTDSASTY